jgi:S-DNA-T family DNA segregation ATPase FtsK/SpoIIIE
MERRYRAMSQLGVRNVGGYNDRVEEAQARGEVVTRRVQTGFDAETGKPMFEEHPLALEKLPFLVVIIDEMADLMMVAGKEIEITVQRLAQMARAAGIHVVMATQRPSVDVITGTIKANFPTRISFTVISKFDSRTILGEQGAEQLLGQGDMLYMQGGGRIGRVHGPFVSDKEVEDVVAFLRSQGEPAYLEEVTEAPDEDETPALRGMSGESGDGNLFDQAVDIVAREGKCSTSFIQRHLSIGYNKAAKLVEQMEKEGIISQANHVGKREILVRRTNED